MSTVTEGLGLGDHWKKTSANVSSRVVCRICQRYDREGECWVAWRPRIDAGLQVLEPGV